MSYTPTKWTDGTTPVDASNMNKIEDALSDQDSRIDANTDLVDSLITSQLKGLTVYSYALGGGASVDINYNGRYCIILATRAASTRAGLYVCDQWNGCQKFIDESTLTVSVSNGVATVTNSANSYSGIVAFVIPGSVSTIN